MLGESGKISAEDIGNLDMAVRIFVTESEDI